MADVLVTGGAGFCGRHLVSRLLDRGDEVTVVDPIVPGTGGIHPMLWPDTRPWYYHWKQKFFLYKVDCRDWFRVHPTAQFDYAFHLAAIVGGREMIENNPLAVADDLSIDAAYWQWAVGAKPKKSVIFSSSAAYPVHMQTAQYHRDYQGILLAEHQIDFAGRTIGVPDMTYGWAKLTVEMLARLAYQKHGLKSVCFRPFSGYGENQDMAYPFPALCKRVVENTPLEPIHVWGTGEQIRDFIYIEDCIDGVLAMMDQIDDGSAVNLSTGVGTSFLELIRLASEAAGYAIMPQIRSMSDKPVGVFARVGDVCKQRSLGFDHKTPLREGVSKMVAYLKEKAQDEKEDKLWSV